MAPWKLFLTNLFRPMRQTWGLHAREAQRYMGAPKPWTEVGSHPMCTGQGQSRRGLSGLGIGKTHGPEDLLA